MPAIQTIQRQYQSLHIVSQLYVLASLRDATVPGLSPGSAAALLQRCKSKAGL
jgi:hypothetical protein